MNLLTLDPGTMAGMTDEHFIASVEPLLMTPLEKELFKRFAECSLNNTMVSMLAEAGLDDEDCLQEYLNQPECPSKEALDDMIDDALYLMNMFANGTEGREVADNLHTALESLQEDLL
jgi:hypothetical protein